jgi:hypothetical protein
MRSGARTWLGSRGRRAAALVRLGWAAPRPRVPEASSALRAVWQGLGSLEAGREAQMVSRSTPQGRERGRARGRCHEAVSAQPRGEGPAAAGNEPRPSPC